MTPASRPHATAAPPPMRQSCDRCHKQKVRCTRTGNNNTGACDRCLSKRAQCVYSSSLPKGRPSLYRFADDDSPGRDMAGPAESPAPLGPGTTPKRHRRASSKPTSARARDDVPIGLEPSMGGGDACIDPGLSSNLLFAAMSTEGSGLVDISPDSWQYVAGLDCDSMKTVEADPQSRQATFNWHAIMDPPPQSTSDLLTRPAPAGTPGRDYGPSGPLAPPPALPAMPAAYPGDGKSHAKDPDAVIAELARLSVHLASLLRSNCSLSELDDDASQPTGPDHQSPLVDDATFESVAAWLTRGSVQKDVLSPLECHQLGLSPIPCPKAKTTGAILYYTLSASQHLLEIVCCLQPNRANGGSTPSTLMSSSPMSSLASHESSYFSLPKASSSLPTSPPSPTGPTSQTSLDNCSHIIRDLLIACHTMLLNRYAAVLVALDREADLRAHNSMTVIGDVRPAHKHYKPFDISLLIPSARARLVTIVQLCSYLIERQHKAMLLSSKSLGTPGVPIPQSLDLNNAPASDTASWEATKDLKCQVQEQLMRLQHKLCT
ncbi:hypothetical protein ARAM_003404 [Aspergillus rambellii]|uniref:Zn(2)-C6 fungal-type domain-containing protein n=1 Tax=Aspergillus rambellii TaxID=308745 RepID=A0A0F8X0A4_9EURO|nr:hypothetical protein ARAM_003404 [Aspergillus rambellii]